MSTHNMFSSRNKKNIVTFLLKKSALSRAMAETIRVSSFTILTYNLKFEQVSLMFLKWCHGIRNSCYKPVVMRKEWKWNQQLALKLFTIFSYNKKRIRQCAKQKNISKQYLSSLCSKVPQKYSTKVSKINPLINSFWFHSLKSLNSDLKSRNWE